MHIAKTCASLCLAAVLVLPALARADTKFLKDENPEQAKWRALRQASQTGNATPETPKKRAAPAREKGTLEAAKDSLSVSPSYNSASMSGGVKAGMDIPVTIGGGPDNATKKTGSPSQPVKVHIRPEGSVDTKGGGGGGVGVTLPF